MIMMMMMVVVAVVDDHENDDDDSFLPVETTTIMAALIMIKSKINYSTAQIMKPFDHQTKSEMNAKISHLVRTRSWMNFLSLLLSLIDQKLTR